MSKIGRNDHCPCESGLKYKKCCLGKNIPDSSLDGGGEESLLLGRSSLLNLKKGPSEKPQEKKGSLTLKEMVSSNVKELSRKYSLNNFQKSKKAFLTFLKEEGEDEYGDQQPFLFSKEDEDGKTQYGISYDDIRIFVKKISGEVSVSTSNRGGEESAVWLFYLMLNTDVVKEEINHSTLKSFEVIKASLMAEVYGEKALKIERLIYLDSFEKVNFEAVGQCSGTLPFENLELPLKDLAAESFGSFANFESLDRGDFGEVGKKILFERQSPADHILIEFSDKVKMTISQLANHPYYSILPDELKVSFFKTLASGDTSSEQGYSFERFLGRSSPYGNMNSSGFDLFEYISYLMKTSLEQGFLYIGRKTDSFKNRDFFYDADIHGAFDVYKVNAVEPEDSRVQMDLVLENNQAHLLAKGVKSSAKNIKDNFNLSTGKWIDKSKNSLSAFDFNQSLSSLIEKHKTENYAFHYAYSRSKTLKKDEVKFQFVPEDPLLEICQNFKTEYGLNFGEVKTCSQTNFQLRTQLNLSFPQEFSGNNEAFVDLKFFIEASEKLYVEPPMLIKNIFNMLTKGISGFYCTKGSRLVKSRYGDKRANELLFYRHKGFSVWLIQTLFQHAKGDVEIEKKLSSILESMVPLVHKILKLNKPDEKSKKIKASDLNSFFTPTFIKNLKRIILFFLNPKNHKQKIFLPQQGFFMISLYEASEDISTALIYGFLRKGGEKTYLKASHSLMDIQASEHYYGDYLQNTHFLIEPKSDDISALEFYLKGKGHVELSRAVDVCLFEGKEASLLTDKNFTLQVSVSDQEDWFDLEPKYFLNGKQISPDEAYSFREDGVIEHKGEFYLIDVQRLPKIKWLNYFWDKIQDQEEGKKGSKESGSSIYHLPRAEVLEVLALRREGVAFIGQQAVRWNKICEEFDNLEESVKLPLPKNLIKGKLKPFQEEGVKWFRALYGIEMGGVLADDMGLGKTVQMIAFLSLLKKSKKLGKVLLTVPTSLSFNWKSELDKFSSNLKITDFESSKAEASLDSFFKSDCDIMLATYGQVLAREKDFLNNTDFHIAIFDEAQNIKNIKSKRACVVRALSAKYKYCLTGTPMENHFGELYSVFDLVCPGALGTYGNFLKNHKVKDVGGDQSAKTIEKISLLKKTISPLVLRREKKMVLNDLPDLQESIVQVPFDKEQKKIYRDLAISWNNRVQSIIDTKGESKSQIEMLTALLRLRQVCSVPQAVPNVKYKGLSPKIEFLIEKVAELVISGKSVLIFTSFLKTLDIVSEELARLGVEVYTISGGKSKKEREQSIGLFKQESSKGKVLLMTLKTGGVGLNLTNANYVFHLEPWWNPAAENQATDRAYRMGQKDKVHVYRYIMKDSIEERMQKLKDKKAAAFAQMFTAEDIETIESAQISSSKLTKQDFDYLLGH